MKRILLTALALMLVFSLAACQAEPAAAEPEQAEPAAEAEPSAEEPASDETIIIGMSQYVNDTNGNIQMDAFQRFVDDWNAAGKTPKLECYITVADNSVDKQIGDVQSLVARGCEVIYLCSADPVGLIPAAEEAIANGVQILEARGMVHDDIVSFKGGDENVMAETTFEWYKTLMDENPDLNLKIGAMYGLASQTDQLIRVDRVLELLEENYPDRVEVLASQPCDWDAQKGMECMENWYQTYKGEMNCIVAAAASMAIGGSQALVAAGEDVGNDWIITCYDNTEDVITALKNDQASMTVGINADTIGYNAADVCVQMAQGTFTDNIYICGNEILETIDRENVVEWETEHPDLIG